MCLVLLFFMGVVMFVFWEDDWFMVNEEEGEVVDIGLRGEDFMRVVMVEGGVIVCVLMKNWKIWEMVFDLVVYNG